VEEKSVWATLLGGGYLGRSADRPSIFKLPSAAGIKRRKEKKKLFLFPRFIIVNGIITEIVVNKIRECLNLLDLIISD
jgi:hypothetical protein